MPEKSSYIYGLNAVQELILYSAGSVVCIYINAARQDKRVRSLMDLAEKTNIEVQKLASPAFADLLAGVEQRAENINHQGVLAACKPSQEKGEDFLQAMVNRAEEQLLFLVLDGVTDPHNLGACIRSANAAGADAVIVPKDNAVGLTPVVRKVASGAAETTPLIVVKNLARCIKKLQQDGVWVMGAAGETATSLYELDLTASTALVMGAEGAGLRRLTRERCDQLFAIPMVGTVESLNVSVAAGICLFECRRQRTIAR